jgi:hypothetical protein
MDWMPCTPLDWMPLERVAWTVGGIIWPAGVSMVLPVALIQHAVSSWSSNRVMQKY